MDFNFFERTMMEWIAPAIFLGAVVFELFFLLFFFLRLLFLRKKSGGGTGEPISICLSVRNEEERIESVLTGLLGLDYPNYEVVLVDDFSEDHTLLKVAQLARKYPNLKYTSISQETNFSEKIAINLALKAASHDRVVFLSPDSQSVDPAFLKKLDDNAGDSNLLMGYMNFAPQKKWRNKLCRMERLAAFIDSAAFSLGGLPVIYEDCNVLFRKSIYFEQSGFRGKMNDHFANLELVFNDRFKKKTRVSIDPETFIHEQVRHQRGDFFDLLKKRIRLNQQLGFWKRLVYFMGDLSKYLFLGALVWMLVTEPKNWLFVVVPAMLVFILQFFVLKSVAAHLEEGKIFLSSFVYVYVRPVLNLSQATKNYIHDKRNKWN
jgi:glycosyltransferase involved in cell wall biosynthesis